MWYKAFHCNNDQHNGQKVPKFVWINAQWTERPQISNNLKFASPFVLKNHSNTSAETRVARGSDGKPYPHSCCSWKVTYWRSSWRKRTRICSKTNLSNVKMVSTADTPRVYFSMKVSPSGPVTSSCPEAAITANDCLSSNSSEAWKREIYFFKKAQ